MKQTTLSKFKVGNDNATKAKTEAVIKEIEAYNI